MARRLIFVVACSTAILSAASSAQPVADLTREQASERGHLLFQTFDLNHDGLVTREEAQQIGIKLMLIRAKTGVDPAPGLGGHTMRFLRHAFAGMQSVTEPQFEQAFLTHFDEMDTNHDGILTAAERERASGPTGGKMTRNSSGLPTT